MLTINSNKFQMFFDVIMGIMKNLSFLFNFHHLHDLKFEFAYVWGPDLADTSANENTIRQNSTNQISIRQMYIQGVQPEMHGGRFCLVNTLIIM